MNITSVNRSWVVLLGALIFGGLAVYGSSHYISQTISAEKARLAPNVQKMDVVVAKADLQIGDLVGSENMAVRGVPKEYVPGTAVLPADFGAVEGAKLAVAMHSGEVLIRGTLEGADAATFATKVRVGTRAITLSVDEVNSLSGLLQPGDHVDLYYTARPPARNSQSAVANREQTLMLMQNVAILATGRQLRPSMRDGSTSAVGRAFTTITIEAVPHDAQRLILAQKTGALTATLRAPQDATPAIGGPLDAGVLFGEAQASSAHRGGPGGPRAEIIIGGQGSGAGRQSVPIPLAFAAVPAAAAGATTAEPAAERLLKAMQPTPIDTPPVSLP